MILIKQEIKLKRHKIDWLSACNLCPRHLSVDGQLNFKPGNEDSEQA